MTVAISGARAMSCQRLASAELEADAVDGFDGVVAVYSRQLGADVADVAVDGAIRHLDVELIGGAHDLLAAEHERRPRQKGAQDSKFDGGQTKRGACKFC